MGIPTNYMAMNIHEVKVAEKKKFVFADKFFFYYSLYMVRMYESDNVQNLFK